jgi:uncharacterized protein YkwD
VKRAVFLLLGFAATLAVVAGQPTRCSVPVDEALRRINAARAAGQRCGWRSMPPAPKLRWNAALQAAASGHSRDMARRNYFDHRSPEGRTVSERTSATHYKFRLWARTSLVATATWRARCRAGWTAPRTART